ncbi:GntR family transcriptional regulator [Falsirhodobacter sp. 20TX0035]|uniref:GntR family transcriptional regulator n=1 Tax=Falsirhodobacter sp. 20TX0035 TaxID=3022019 RepID=UPI0023308A38|nr:GntR family transcriptional regulator [Falsirhodobacter sp. 20TX0035]MDB6454219.1 GntR family transcriptional regulator [Falsirhodobacter sp. 20TX0035]
MKMTQGPGLAAQARRQIVARIFDGRLASGALLQEASLGQELGMSRTPVREAIKRIESEGLAVRDGRFTRVRKPSAAEVEEIFFLRLQLEPRATRAAVALPEYKLSAMEARVEALVAGRSTEDLWTVDDDFHDMMLIAANSVAMREVVQGLRRRTSVFDAGQVPERYMRGCEEHLAIVVALRTGDGEGAAASMAVHLAHARDAILQRLSDPSVGSET